MESEQKNMIMYKYKIKKKRQYYLITAKEKKII